MNIHLPAILGFTRYQGFDPSPYILLWCWTFWMEYQPAQLNRMLCMVFVIGGPKDPSESLGFSLKQWRFTLSLFDLIFIQQLSAYNPLGGDGLLLAIEFAGKKLEPTRPGKRTKSELENGHWNSGFTHWKWWFSIEIYSGFSHWKWWFSSLFCKRLPEGNVQLLPLKHGADLWDWDVDREISKADGEVVQQDMMKTRDTDLLSLIWLRFPF